MSRHHVRMLSSRSWCVLLLACNCALPGLGLAFDTVLSDGWRFSRDDGVSWRVVRVPHDWAIEGPFDLRAKDGGTARLPWRGKGLYRRTFDLTAADAEILSQGGRAYLTFDGVMASPCVRVNGRTVGGWDYGYMSFSLDVTDCVCAGKNELEVSADTTGHDSRCYPGAGIYRKVVFSVKPRDHVIPYSLAITTPVVTATSAVVSVSFATPYGGPTNYAFSVANPRFWDVDDPYLYSIDLFGERYSYGIRTAVFTADDGFHLNGRRVQIKGVNLHSDLGLLGMAFDRSAMRRQLRCMKEMGANAVRTSHNAPAPDMLALCDEMGLLVWDECFDKWDATCGRRPDQNLEDYVVRNLRQFVRRDRNHPSVIAWSISNEVWEWNPSRPKRSDQRWSDHGPDGQTRSRNRLFAAAVRSEDETRAVGCGNRPFMNEPDVLDMNLWEEMDVTGWNYFRSYAPVHRRFPSKALVYTESASAFSSQGYFDRSITRSRRHYSSRFETGGPWQVDGRDLETSLGVVDEEFDYMARDRYVAGEFVWTGIDYLGEPAPFEHVARSSYFGIADLLCVPKDRWYLYRSHWNPKASTLWIAPHWNWQEGDNVDVYVYSDCDEAELLLNGKSLGRRRKRRQSVPQEFTNECYRACSNYRLMWFDVPYEPGELKAVAYRGGAAVQERSVRTAGEAVRLVARPEPCAGKDEDELIWVLIEAVDAQGERTPWAQNRFSVTLEGDGIVLGTGNADPTALESFADPVAHRLFYGQAMTVVRRVGPGQVKLTVASPELKSSTVGL